MITEQTAKKEAAHPTEPFQLATLDQAELPPLPSSSPFRQTFHCCSTSPLLSFPLLPFALLPRKKKVWKLLFSSFLLSSSSQSRSSSSLILRRGFLPFPFLLFLRPFRRGIKSQSHVTAAAAAPLGEQRAERILGIYPLCSCRPSSFLPSCRLPPPTSLSVTTP